MEITVDEKGNRLAINRPKVQFEDLHYSVGIYDPYRSPNFGLYEAPARGRPDILAPPFSTYFQHRKIEK